MLVGPTEVGADENLRLQLWDSGEFVAHPPIFISFASIGKTVTGHFEMPSRCCRVEYSKVVSIVQAPILAVVFE